MSSETMSTTIPMKQVRFPTLDGIRGIAVLMVMFVHFSFPGTPTGSVVDYLFRGTAWRGWMGVDLFFVLSGFLITGILMDSKSDENFFRNFYARRILRIFPIYYLYLAGLFLVLPGLHVLWAGVASNPEYLILRDNQAMFWLYLSNFYSAKMGTLPFATSHLWSLAVEEQFYVFWPLVVYCCRPKSLLRFCVSGILVSLMVRITLTQMGYSPHAVYVNTFCRMDTLFVGSILAVLYRTPGQFQALGERLWLWRGYLIALFLGVFLASRGFDFRSKVTMEFGYLAIAASFGIFLACSLMVPSTHRLYRMLTHPLLKYFGKYSYAIYLLHMSVQAFTVKFIVSPDAFPRIGNSSVFGIICYMLVAIAMTLAAAVVSWHVCEKHFIKLKEYFA